MNIKKLAAVAAVASVLALALTGCAPSKEQLACEKAGGSWDAHVIGYTTTYTTVNKVLIPITSPVYAYRCDGAEE